ncbi:Methyltransferase FkbM [Olavius algarvensis associated proteobacterium Delta 3]|nr:Methyltransferase FkbM [Olavius algarvensis associated proteobacterium Delta 3]CAB5101207.1 Methyltransferase FkbM [Olavius algarvensis associated proteobacterium Delta 3]
MLKRIKKIKQVFFSYRLLKALIRHRVLGGAEHRYILEHGFKTVVDIGANRGQFTLASRTWAPSARVIAFEPLQRPADRFQKVFKEDSNVILHRVAIGSYSGNAVIHISAADDSSSLLPIGALQEKYFPGTKEVGKKTVQLGKLHEYVSKQELIAPAMLKIDVQGYELESLIGCDKLLERFSHIYVECSFVELYSGQALAHEVIDWLRNRHFQLKGVFNISYQKNGNALQGDFFFVNHNGNKNLSGLK